jgi:hypothetical protein
MRPSALFRRIVLYGSSTAAALGALSLASPNLRAATVELKNGNVDSGWVVHFEDGLGVAFVGVTSDRAEVKIQKIADFRDPFDGGVGPVLELVFEQVRSDATPFVTIDSESVTNNTGSDWSGFRFFLNNIEGEGDGARFDAGRTFGDSDPFDISPFTTFAYNATFTDLVLGGGTVQDGQTWLPGAGNTGGDFVIDARPGGEGDLVTFKFDEQPLIDTPIIPLPPAVWSGLAGLAGVGLMNYRAMRRRR